MILKGAVKKLIANYRGKIYIARVIKNNKIAIWTTDEMEEFNKIIEGDYICFEKECNKSELQELYDINFFAEWNGKIFNCGYDGNRNVILRESKDISYAKDHDFEQLDRFFYVKIVPLEQCTKLGILKQDLLQDEYGRLKEERIVSIDEFEKLYTENIIDLFQRNTKNKGERVWEK